VGAWITAAGAAIFIANIIKSTISGKPANMEDPFKLGEQYYDYTKREPHH
jgi:heme/copper-type cytochrome/quinol oxidase subunit 1